MTQRTRLQWLCRRGMRELDLVLMGYLERDYDAAGPAEQAAFIRLLDESDDSLWRYFYGDVSPDDTVLAALVRKIRSAAASHP
jgi:antitoxin CptB